MLGACAKGPSPVVAPDPTAEAAAASVPAARAHSWYLRARVAEGLGDEAMATRGMSWARRLDPDDPDLLALLAAYAERSGDDEGALERWLDALDARPEATACELAGAHRGAALAWIALGHPGDARAHVDALAAGGCPSPALEVELAHQLGDVEGARAALATWHPVAPEDRLQAAQWALQLGEAHRALAWIAPLAGHPGWPDAASVLAQVAQEHPEPVRALLAAVARGAGPPWTDLLAELEAR